MTRVQVSSQILRWAWERGEKQLTLKQLQTFAKAAHTPIGYFFLPEPPVERLPIQGFRTVREGSSRPSADLLDTIYAMQRWQDWFREERREGEGEPPDFVGSTRLADEQETERPKWLPSEVVAKIKAEGFPRFGINHHADLWKRSDAKGAGKGFGVRLAKTWYWDGSWSDEVRKHCKEQAEVYQ